MGRAVDPGACVGPGSLLKKARIWILENLTSNNDIIFKSLYVYIYMNMYISIILRKKKKKKLKLGMETI